MKQKTNKSSLPLNGEDLSIQALNSIIKNPKLGVFVTEAALKKVKNSHDFLAEALITNNKIIYGINTGFGPMASYILAHDQITDLQKNLILSHAVGLGEKIPDQFTLAAMVIRLNTFAKAYPGASPELLSHIAKFINARIIPVIPEHGAVGTSGDLVQLAHIALALLGKGQVSYKNSIQKTSAVFKQLKLKPYHLKPKEGLSLINGTSVMTGIAANVCWQSRNLLSLAVRNGCLALEIVKAYDDSFGDKLHSLRPHPGQVAIASMVRKITGSSKLIRNREILNKKANLGTTVQKINESVQEFYSLRCMSQILGPVYESLSKAWKTTEIEMNSVTDNPIVDWENGKFLHGGNFHGDYIAVNMDQLKMSLVKMTMLSERRLNFFLHDKINGLFPPFQNLDTPGLTLGLQGLQFVASSTTANSQTLGYPMNLHSIPTNGDNQDVVSMGTDAALFTSKVVNNGFIVLAIESLALCQAVDFLKVRNQLSNGSKALYDFVRTQVPTIVADRHVQPELENLLSKIQNWPELEIFEKF